MPYKSEAQRRLFHWLSSQGKIGPGTVREYDKASKGKKLPEYVQKAFGGQVSAKAGTHCPACDYPLDQAPVAMDAGEGCPRCGYGSAKDVPQRARGGEMLPKSHSGHGGEVMDPSMYRARGGRARQYAKGGKVDKAMTWTSAKEEAKSREYFDKLEAIRLKYEGIQQKIGYYDDAANKRMDAQKNREIDALSRQYGETNEASTARQQRRQLQADLATRGAIEGEMGPPVPPLTYAHGGEVCSKCGHEDKMARGGVVSHCARCGSPMAMGGYVPLKAYGGEIGLEGDLKELYPSKRERGADLDDGKIRKFGKMFVHALKHRRR